MRMVSPAAPERQDDLTHGAWSPVPRFDPSRGLVAVRDRLPGILWKLQMRRLAAQAADAAVLVQQLQEVRQ
jgi:hypothetical protein